MEANISGKECHAVSDMVMTTCSRCMMWALCRYKSNMMCSFSSLPNNSLNRWDHGGSVMR